VTKARPVFPNETLFSTRRVHKRQFLLKSHPDVEQAIEYIVAVLCERYGIDLHALSVLSNHKHDVSTDPHAAIVEFQRDCHQLIARCLNARFGDFESMWSSVPTNRVTCAQPIDVLDKIGYTLANPVSSYLVADGADWPGVRSAWPAKPRVVKRPSWFFRSADDGGEWPEQATLRFSRPPGFDDLSDSELAGLIARVTAAKEEEAREEARSLGIDFVGKRGLRRQSRYGYPSSKERRFGIRPRVAAKSKSVRLEILRRNRLWLAEYERARDLFMSGATETEFPFGTYKMRVVFGVRCRPPP
jgi:putative transposase